MYKVILLIRSNTYICLLHMFASRKCIKVHFLAKIHNGVHIRTQFFKALKILSLITFSWQELCSAMVIAPGHGVGGCEFKSLQKQCERFNLIATVSPLAFSDSRRRGGIPETAKYSSGILTVAAAH